MRIRAFILGCVATLAMLAFAPVAMADPAPDICVLNLSHPVDLDHAIGFADMSCAVMATADVASAVPIAPGDEDEAVGPVCSTLAHATFTPRGYRLHVDPGRCPV